MHIYILFIFNVLKMYLLKCTYIKGDTGRVLQAFDSSLIFTVWNI